MIVHYEVPIWLPLLTIGLAFILIVYTIINLRRFK